MLALIAACAIAPAPADLVIQNARIWSDGLPSFARFAAVREGRFVFVGGPKPEYVGEGTVILDAGGKTVLPGLVDSHTHMLSGGLNLSRVALRDAVDKADFIRRVEAYVRTLGAGEWVLGGRYSVESWAKPEEPHRTWVDPVTGSRPLWLSRMDGHSGLANSAALRIAGITKDTPNPPGGVIDKDPVSGEPTGVLRETAMGLVTRHIPDTSPAQNLRALRAAMKEANRFGVTAVSDIPPLSALNVYEELLTAGGQTVRFALYPTGGAESVAERVKTFKGRIGSIEIRGFKAYMDGSLGSRTAYMREPFADNEPSRKDWRGMPMPGMTDGGFEAQCRAASAAGLQAICHAIGDEANHQLLNILERAYPNLRDARCRDEHTQHLLPADIPRFASLGVIASIQPYHKADDGRYAEQRIGIERCRSSYAFKSILDAGGTVVFGSDWPVVSINPFLGVEAAVTGKTLAGNQWMTQENLTVAEALRCYTTRGAYAMFQEDEIGKIAPGFRADFIVLNESPFSASPKWSAIRPVGVYVEGKRVFGENER
jgi:predicted amidohydrolase YtcJ